MALCRPTSAGRAVVPCLSAFTLSYLHSHHTVCRRWPMRSRHRSRLSLETLETRWCPAVTAILSGGTLSLTGDSTDLKITQTAAGTFSVTDNGSPVGGSSFASVKHLDIDLGAGNDKVALA